jgi:ATP-dependent RNA helicase DeaD
VHRIGRVGRAGREGVAITLVEPREHHQLRNIERVTKHRIEVAKVPTVADLRTRRLELTRAALREAIVSEDKEHFRVVVDALSDEFDLVEIAMGAVKLYHQATVGDADEEEAEVPEAQSKPAGKRKEGPRPYGLGAPTRGGGGEMTKLFITAGRQAGVARRTSSAPSPTRRACRAAPSARSRSRIASPSSRCPRPPWSR